MKRALTLGAGLLAIGLAVARPALAEDARNNAAAEQLFQEGKRLVGEGRYAEACPKLAESLRLDPGIGIRLHLASCYEKAGKLASAWAEFREAEQIAARENDKRADVAKKHAAAIEPSLFRLTISVPPASDAPELEVRRDGEWLGRAQWGVAVPVDPGSHVIEASAKGRVAWRSAFDVPARGGAANVIVPALAPIASTAPAPASAPPPASVSAPAPGPEPAPHDGRRIAALSVAGAGVVALGVGIYFGISAKQKLDDSNQNGCRTDNRCDPTGAGLRNDARTAGNFATVASLVGLAAVGAGAALYFTGSKERGVRVVPTAGARAGGLRLEGSF